jgi:hypothetical protein
MCNWYIFLHIELNALLKINNFLNLFEWIYMKNMQKLKIIVLFSIHLKPCLPCL